MKYKTGNLTKVDKKTNDLKIKKAISRFISNTQKIVQSVNPEAKIIIPKKTQAKKKIENCEKKEVRTTENKKQVISIPNFKGKF